MPSASDRDLGVGSRPDVDIDDAVLAVLDGKGAVEGFDGLDDASVTRPGSCSPAQGSFRLCRSEDASGISALRAAVVGAPSSAPTVSGDDAKVAYSPLCAGILKVDFGSLSGHVDLPSVASSPRHLCWRLQDAHRLCPTGRTSGRRHLRHDQTMSRSGSTCVRLGRRRAGRAHHRAVFVRPWQHHNGGAGHEEGVDSA